MFFYYRATETQVKVEESSTEKTDESAVPDDIKAFYQKIDEDDDDEEESKGLILKFIYSEKATKFCEIFPLILTVCTVVKSKVKIL